MGIPGSAAERSRKRQAHAAVVTEADVGFSAERFFAADFRAATTKSVPPIMVVGPHRAAPAPPLWKHAPPVDGASYPFSVPRIRSLPLLDLNVPVTFFVGENGSGKSTLLEGIAAAAELPAMGGSQVASDETLAPLASSEHPYGSFGRRVRARASSSVRRTSLAD